MRSPTPLRAPLLALLLVTGCGDAREALDGGALDAMVKEASATDDASRLSSDAPVPVEASVVPDVPMAHPDVAFDAPTTVTIDVPMDAPRDVPRDLPPDASRDAGVDASVRPGDPARPFGAHTQSYPPGTLAPTQSPAALDRATAALYDRWKAAHVVARCGAGRYLVDTDGDTTGATVSEAHGWGMVITVLMAGHDPAAHTVFDGMVRYYQDHPSSIDPALMAWAQGRDCRNVSGSDAATDGDLDIAYALLLADRQWGSRGALDYAALARRMMAAILRREVHPTARTLLVGDWAQGDAQADGTRLSDYAIDHLRAFRRASGDAAWDVVIRRSYEVIAQLQTGYSRDAAGTVTGLVPDFAVGMVARDARPAPARWLEGPNDGAYSWNSCRTPWRLATDYLVSGETRARDAVRPMAGWSRRVSGMRPASIASGYSLRGERLGGTDPGEMAFIAPFAVAAMTDPTQQAWLDALWSHLVATPYGGSRYFGNSIRLLSMIVVSGNWWAP
jgi:hypothetical protein